MKLNDVTEVFFYEGLQFVDLEHQCDGLDPRFEDLDLQFDDLDHPYVETPSDLPLLEIHRGPRSTRKGIRAITGNRRLPVGVVPRGPLLVDTLNPRPGKCIPRLPVDDRGMSMFRFFIE